MGKYYSQYRRPPRPERKWRVHPIWRGIGCLMLVIIPMISWAIAGMLVEANKSARWLAIPAGLNSPFGSSDLLLTALVAAVVAIVLFGAYTIFYMLIYKMLGPPTYGPLDAPPQRRKPMKRKSSYR
jgi:hypothetical protein